MVNPVTGPYVEWKQNPVNATGSYFLGRARYKQAKPYSLVLPYATHFGRTKSYRTIGTVPWGTYTRYGDATMNYGISTHVGVPGARGFGFGDPLVDAYVEMARSKFVSKLQSNRAEWAVTLIQRQQALDSIANRALQLLGAARALRKGGPRAFAKALGLSVAGKSNKPRRTAKSFSAAWLEYSYGWAPLASDIGNSLSLLQDPFPKSRIRGNTGCEVSKTDIARWGYDNLYTQMKQSNREVRVRVQAYAGIDDPNLFLASQLGLTNPATIVWELVPWSFVIDWFVNVNDYLSSFSSLHGVRLESAFTSVKSTEQVTFVETHPDLSSIFPGSQWGSATLVSEVISTARQVGVPSAKLGIRRAGFLNPMRAANAISLLIQQGLKPGAR